DRVDRPLDLPPAVVVDRVRELDLDALNVVRLERAALADVEQRVERRMDAAHRGVRLDHDALGLPFAAEAGGDLRRVRIVSLAKGGEEAAVGALEPAPDAGVAAFSGHRGIDPVARPEAVV